MSERNENFKLEVSSLGLIGRIETGSTPSKQIKDYYGNDYPFYKPADLEAGKNVSKATDNLSHKGIKKARYLPENSVLVTCIGATIGKTGLIKKAGASNQQINAIIPFENNDPAFVYYQIIGPVFQKAIKDNASATTLPILNKKKFQNLPFILTTLDNQKQIVSKIEELFSEIENGIKSLFTAKEQLKKYRQSVLKWAFEGKLSESGFTRLKDEQDSVNKKILQSSNSENPDSDKEELPEGWKWVKIEDVASINPKLPKKDEINDDVEIQFLPMKLVDEIVNKIHLIETRLFKEVQKGSYTPFIDGDIIFAKVTPCMENGKIAVVENLKNGIAYGSSEFHVLRCAKDALNKYLFYFIVQDRFRNEAQNAMTGAVGLRRVPKQFIENHLIPLPSIIEQNKIVEAIESRLSVADKMEESISQSLQQAEALKQSILKKAFKGKLF